MSLHYPDPLPTSAEGFAAARVNPPRGGLTVGSDLPLTDPDLKSPLYLDLAPPSDFATPARVNGPEHIPMDREVIVVGNASLPETPAPFRFQQIDRSDPDFVYVGYLREDGAWFIWRRDIITGDRLEASAASGYTASWNFRDTLDYG